MENVDYIDSYFQGELPVAEAGAFEKRMADEPEFSRDVAFYLSAVQAAKEMAVEDRKKRFREIYEDGKTAAAPAPVRRLWPYISAAAMAIGIIVGLFIFTRSASPQQLADQYIRQHFKVLEVTMSSRADSMQTALKLYNEGRFSDALQQFEQILQSDTSNAEAKKDAGIVYLHFGEYDKALDLFLQLENNAHLHSNYGKFYHALTLLKRGRDIDRIPAKQLLQQVVEQDLEGKDDAAQWLKKW